MRRLAREFLAREAVVLAPLLLNKVFRFGACAGRITEVEAYSQDDPASHTFGGLTKRNEVMFGAAGTLYVYFTYGMHHCANVVAGEPGNGQAVLVRAVSPMLGLDVMNARRNGRRHLANGPAKLCQAFGIDLTSNGTDLCDPSNAAVGLFDDGVVPPASPLITPRIGISRAIDWPRRFVVPPTT